MRRKSIALLILASSMISSSAVKADEIPLTRLVMRDSVVEITSNSDGIKYSVTTKDGKVLSENLDEAQLAQKHPDVYDQVRPAIANPGSKGFSPWAGTFPN